MIALILTSDPARNVKSNEYTTSGRFVSHKNGQTIQFESLRVELAYLLLAEINPEVMLFRCQPHKFKIKAPDKNGVLRAIDYTPDFFVISKDFIGFIQCKDSDETMLKLSQKHPGRYHLEDGEWVYPAVDEVLEGTGLGHKFFIRNREKTIRVDNACHIADFMNGRMPAVEEGLQEAVLKTIREQQVISMQELLNCRKSIKVNQILWMIGQNLLVVDWDNERFSRPAQCHLFASDEVKRSFINKQRSMVASDLLFSNVHEIKVGNQYRHGDSYWKVLSLDAPSNSVMVEVVTGNDQPRMDHYSYSNFTLQVKTGALRQVYETDQASVHRQYLRGYSPETITKANQRMEVIVQLEEKRMRPGEAAASLGVSCETVRNYHKRYKKAQISFGCGYYGLLDDDAGKGNRSKRFSEQTEKLIEKYINAEFKTPTVKNVSGVHASFKEDCGKLGIGDVSLETFRKRILAHQPHELAQPRHGSKAANNLRPGLDPSIDTSDPHGERAFQRAHTDHTLIDLSTLRVLSAEEAREHIKAKKKNVNRIWLTLMIDAYSRAPLGVYLSFDNPSRASLMMVVRDCVRRNGRLPEELVVDGGAEFKSVYFQKLCARYGITIIDRTGKAKVGSLIERMFGTLNTSFFYKMEGNTQNTRNVRQMSKEVNPYRLALWNIKRLKEALERFLFQLYINQTHSAMGISPATALSESIEKHGVRDVRNIEYSEEFLALTLIEDSQLMRKILVSRGVKFNNKLFSHEKLNDPKWVGKSVPIRYDPMDNSYIAVCLGAEWVLARRREQEDKYHDGFSREEISAARFFQMKSANDQQFPMNLGAILSHSIQRRQ